MRLDPPGSFPGCQAGCPPLHCCRYCQHQHASRQLDVLMYQVRVPSRMLCRQTLLWGLPSVGVWALG